MAPIGANPAPDPVVEPDRIEDQIGATLTIFCAKGSERGRYSVVTSGMA